MPGDKSFALSPFRAEYHNGQPFGSMWNDWVRDLVAAEGLGNRQRAMNGNVVCVEDLPEPKIEQPDSPFWLRRV